MMALPDPAFGISMYFPLTIPHTPRVSRLLLQHLLECESFLSPHAGYRNANANLEQSSYSTELGLSDPSRATSCHNSQYSRYDTVACLS